MKKICDVVICGLIAEGKSVDRNSIMIFELKKLKLYNQANVLGLVQWEADLSFSLSMWRCLPSGKIPPDSTLTFIIEVLDIRNGPRSHESFQEMDLNDDWKLSKQEVSSRVGMLLFFTRKQQKKGTNKLYSV